MKKTLIWFLSVLILAQVVYAGVTNPLPTELNLFKGESGRFKFQIQTIASNQEVECSYYMAEESPLVVVFDPGTIIVPANSVKEVRGTVTVPQDTALGTYNEEFCISCKPTQSASGSAVNIDTCDLPIKVNVVEERVRENMYIPPKPSQPIGLATILVIAGIILIAASLVSLFGYRIWKRRSKKPVAKDKPVKKNK